MRPEAWNLPQVLPTALLCAVLVVVSAAWCTGQVGSSVDEKPNSQTYLHYSLGRLMEVNGAHADALVQYRRANSLHPGNCDIETAIARVQYSLGNLEGALEKTALSIERCPDNLEARALRAEVMLVDGSPKEAALLLRDLAQEEDAPREIVALFGQALLSQGRLREGEEYLRERTSIDSLDSDAAALHGHALLLLGDADAAVEQLARSVRLNPFDRAAAGVLSRLLVAMDRPEEGVPILERLVARAAPSEPELVSLATGYSMLGEYERALAVLSAALEQFGATEDILRARASACFDAGDLDGALESYEQIITLNEESIVALNFIAYTLADENRDLDRALDYALKAVALDPDNSLLRDTLGWAYYRTGRLEDARRELRMATELGGDNAVILEHLGDVLFDLGQGEEAVAAWKRALEVEPGSATILQRLEATREDPERTAPGEPEDGE